MDDKLISLNALPLAQLREDIRAMCGECDAWNKYKNYSQPGWIPCSERNPEKNGFYLVTTKAVGWNCKEYTDVDTSYYGDGIWYRKRVLAWMPLPIPWEGEKP